MSYQREADKFFKAWSHFTGYNGITDSIHLLGAEHLQHFL
jgi:hypothetical protein